MGVAARVLIAAAAMFALGAGMGAGFGVLNGSATAASNEIAVALLPQPEAVPRPGPITVAPPPPPPATVRVVAAVPPAIEPTPAAPLPAAPLAAWQRFAVPSLAVDGPRIAVVLDDAGVHVPNGVRAAELPAPVTLALMTYAQGVDDLAAWARANGHELLVHVPMEPNDGRLDTGPNALRTGLDATELARRIEWALSRFEGAVGVNNHMGSRFTADPEAMAVLMAALGERGLLFLDSITTGRTKGRATARTAGVPYLARDVFLDNEADPESVWARIAEVEALARRNGSAIAIAHPKGATLEVLRVWLPTLAERGITLVPLSALVRAPQPVVAALGR